MSGTLSRPLSLALRLTLLFAIVTAMVFTGFGWILVRSTENHLETADSDELEVIARAVEDVLTGVREVNQLSDLEQRFDDILVGHHDASLHIVGQDGRTVYSNAGPELSAILQEHGRDDDGDAVHQWRTFEHSYRVLVHDVDTGWVSAAGVHTVVIAVPVDHHLRFLARFRRSLVLTVVCSITLMGFMGWFAVRRGHRPLHEIVEQIRRISASELTTRLDSNAVPRELTKLVVSVNELLERIDRAFHKLSDFNADIAHELRTPIANLLTQSQVVLSKARSAGEYRETLYSSMEELEQMGQMVSDMLFLAQADNPQELQRRTRVNLASEIRALFDFYEAWAEERRVDLVLKGSATVPGNRPMLRRALGNLISNAIRHTPSGGAVTMEISILRQGTVNIAVENPGTAIPAEDIPRLFDRFYRIPSSRQQGDDGVGLGLAIVASIVKLHGGTISVDSGDTGTRFTMTLPG